MAAARNPGVPGGGTGVDFSDYFFANRGVPGPFRHHSSEKTPRPGGEFFAKNAIGPRGRQEGVESASASPAGGGGGARTTGPGTGETPRVRPQGRADRRKAVRVRSSSSRNRLRASSARSSRKISPVR